MTLNTKTKAQILDEYINFKSTNVTTEGKLQEYRRVIKAFLDYAKKPLKDYQEADLVNFLNHVNKKYNIKTVNGIKTLLRNFIVWYYPDYPQRFRSMSVVTRHLRTEPTYTSKDMITKEEFEKLVKAEESIMWKTFWLTQFYGGMRPIETALLQWDNITFANEGAFVQVYVKKNQKNFTKFLPEQVSFYLKKLKESSTSPYVFPSRIKRDGKKTPMERAGIHRRLAKLSIRALNKKVKPYQLRHSIATILYNEDGADKDFVAQQMGHSKNMEKVYSHLNDERIKEKLKKLYLKTEELPTERKHELELEIVKLKDDLKKFKANAVSEILQEIKQSLKKN